MFPAASIFAMKFAFSSPNQTLLSDPKVIRDERTGRGHAADHADLRLIKPEVSIRSRDDIVRVAIGGQRKLLNRWVPGGCGRRRGRGCSGKRGRACGSSASTGGENGGCRKSEKCDGAMMERHGEPSWWKSLLRLPGGGIPAARYTFLRGSASMPADRLCYLHGAERIYSLIASCGHGK
jgi:hypothetical protein